jgi:cyclic beta-1,2-glucan synthetase
MTFLDPSPEKNSAFSAWMQSGLWCLSGLLAASAAWLLEFSSPLGAAGPCATLVLSILCLLVSRGKRKYPWGELICAAVFAIAIGQSVNVQTPVWDVPSTLSEAFTISSFCGALFYLLYFGLTAASLRGRNRALSPQENLSLLSIPFIFGWLLLLAAPQLPPQILAIGGIFGANAWLADVVGRAFILCATNLVVILLLTSLTARHWKPRPALSLLSVFSATLAACTPSIANLSITVGGSWPLPLQVILAIVSVVAAQAGLWGQTFLVTGIFMDALERRQPAQPRAKVHYSHGFFRGAMYSGVFMTLIQLTRVAVDSPTIQKLARENAILFGVFAGALLFPLLRTIVESFDGSEPFISRLRRNHAGYLNYLRGAVLGFGIAASFAWGFVHADPIRRAGWGLFVGVMTYSGVNVVRDAIEILRRHRQKLQPMNVYGVELALGGFAGLALGWYAEEAQLAVIFSKFFRYAALSINPVETYDVYPLFSKWGMIDLGAVGCGSRLLFNESVSGVIGWSLAAPLFSFNLVGLTAILRRSLRPVEELFTSAVSPA